MKLNATAMNQKDQGTRLSNDMATNLKGRETLRLNPTKQEIMK